MLDSPLEDYYTTKIAKERVRKFRALAPTRGGPVSKATVCDMSQNPSAHTRESPFMVTVARSTDLVLLREGDTYGDFYTC